MAKRVLPSAASVGLVIVAACGAYPAQAGFAIDSFGSEGVSPSPAATEESLARREIAAYTGRPIADALAQLRPEWLRPTPFARESDDSPRAVIYMNDVRSGDIRALQTIPSAAVVEVRFLHQSEAQIQYGSACHCPAGVILVRTRSAE
jgi:hypothetical protein